MNQETHIYLYDSGFGTLELARKLLSTGYRVTLFADLGNAPYGNKPPALVKEFARANIEYLHSLTPSGAKSIVVCCCNTADICGLEPLKNEGVFRNTPNQITMGVVRPVIGELVADQTCELAFIHMTQNSFNSGRFMEIEQHRPDMRIIPTAFDGLAPAIDQRQFKDAAMNIFKNIAIKFPNISKDLKNLKTNPRVALCCTHFALLQKHFELAHDLFFNHKVEFVDQAGLVAEMVRHEAGSPATTKNYLGRLLTTGDAAATTKHFQNHEPLRDYWNMFENGANFEHTAVKELELSFIKSVSAKTVGSSLSTSMHQPKNNLTAEGLVLIDQ